MTKQIIKAVAYAIVFSVGLLGTVATGKTKKPKGEFLSLSADPSVVCVNNGIPIVRISFRAKSSTKQCVNIEVNGQNIVGPFESPIAGIRGQNRCGQGEWGETYSFSLSELFGTNIPPTITITARLITGGLSTTARQKELDSTSITVTTRVCGPPELTN